MQLRCIVCSIDVSLKELNLNNCNTNKVFNMKSMLCQCLDELKNRIRNLNLNIKEEAFEEDFDY